MKRKATHILIDIEPLRKKIESYGKIGVVDVQSIALLKAKAFDTGIPVDLSRVGIMSRADALVNSDDIEHPNQTNDVFVYSREGAKWFYQQAANDILNPKSKKVKIEKETGKDKKV